ncbi:protocatechuate 4,5-dioxygenase subunit alpha [Azospirillum soli]|uniref:protocatechuate 4,5-dioxygenase subunit alpha n=1 Tax=Azospirillum soli TaxID=1304799 RepID=UPI001AEB96CA|nr:protocatechuate 4,5-dioxygenase subunit alpha [Azospirillum soli]MBP2315352.1 protocatechuate 4,5-dioxygenase alpha subunit [Azospirillum soli]
MPDLLRIAFIGFGEAASAFVSGWGAGGAAAVRAYDIKTDHPDEAVRAAKAADYQRAGVTGCKTLAEALDGAELVFSLVTADQAAKAAAAAAPLLAEGALFLDGNSCAPGTKRRSAQAVEAAGRGRYVDLAVMAPVHPKRHRTPLLVSGEHAGPAVERLRALEMAPETAEGPVGTASSIKMIRSIMMKGMEALFAECVLAGRKAGVDEVVLDSLDVTFPGFDFKAKAAYMLERSMTHGVRRAAEMREVALTVAELGLPNDMASATVEWQQRMGDLKLDAGNGDYRARADMALEALGHQPAPAPVPAPEYADIPGTFVFDAEQSRQGYHLNMFCMSLRHAANREAFKADEEGYLNRFPMTEEQKRAVLARDWNEMLRLGGNIYYTSKLAATDGINFQQLAARMTGVSEDDYRAMMLGGGRPIAGNRSKKEWGNG